MPAAGSGLRDDDRVAGVGVAGSGTSGAILHGHDGLATGVPDGDSSVVVR